MNIFRTLLVLLIFTGGAGFGLVAGQQKDKRPGLEPYLFETFDKQQKVEAELGRLSVPENRNNPATRMIELAFVRFKSTAKNPGPPIVYLSGGTGSGIAAARSNRFPLFMAMREVGDVIALDLRGIGMSKPNLMCPEPFDYPLDKPDDVRARLQLFRENSTRCAEHFRKQGVDLGGYDTVQMAGDIEDLRRALGVARISLWGISQGTHLSFAVLRKYPESIARVIMAGVEGPDDSLKLPHNIQQTLARISQFAKADPEVSKLVPDFLVLMKTVLDRVEKQPVEVEVLDPETKEKRKVILSKFDLQLLNSFAMGDKDSIRAFPLLYYAMSKGEFTLPARRLLGLGKFRETAFTFVRDCASGGSRERLARIKREAQETLLGDAINFPFPEVCDAWGNPDLGPS